MNIINIFFAILFNFIVIVPSLIAQPQPHTEDLKTEALNLMKSGRYGEAINLLNNYISAKPQQAEGYNLRGLAYEHRGQFEASVYDFRSAKKLEPENSLINENLDRVTGEWYKLIYNDIEGYKREIAIDAGKPINYLQIGKSYKNLGEWAEAEIWYDKYLSMEKASPDEIIRYTEILAKNNHISRGEPILKKYTEEFPEDQRLWSRYGYFLLWLGKTKPAINAFENALKLKPFFKEAMDGLERAKGNGYLYTFNDTASYRQYKSGITKTPGYIIDVYFRRLKKNYNDSNTRINLINELMNVNRYEEAYQQVLILKQQDGSTDIVKRLWETVNSARNKYYTDQITTLEKKIEQNPGNREILLKLAGYYTALSKFDRAVELYSNYLAYHPDDTNVRFLYIKNAAWNKQYKLAGNELDVLILQYPDSTNYKLLRAQIYVWQNVELSTAEKLLNEVLNKEPENFDALLTLAMLKFQQNNINDADLYSSRAGEIDPSNIEVAKLKFEIKKQSKINYQNELYSILEDARQKISQQDCYGAINLFEKYNSLTQPDNNVLLEEADAYICLNDYKRAIGIYNTILNQSYVYEIDKKRAEVLLWSNDPLSALEVLKNLNLSHPDDAEIKMYMGDAYFQLKQYDKARIIYSELLAQSPGSKLLQTRLGWLGEGKGDFTSFNFPSYFLINPEASFYFDNYDFKYSLQGLMLETGLNNFISLGVSAYRGEIDSSSYGLNLYTIKGLMTLRFNKIYSVGFSAGKTFFENNQDILVGTAFLKAVAKNYLASLDYTSQDAAQIFYSPLLVNQRLKVDMVRLNCNYHSESELLASGYYSYYFVSDGNKGNSLLVRVGKGFDELAAGYEFYLLGFNNYSNLYYSPSNFQSHSLWGEWNIIQNNENEIQIGGKIGIIPENNFIIREAFASAKLLLAYHFTLQGRISTGSTERQNLGYSSTSFNVAAFWTF